MCLGHVCTGGMDVCVLGDMCVLRGCVCVGDMDVCLGTQTYTHTDVCAQGHVCWEHAYMCDVYLGTHAGKHVLGNMGVPRGTCVSLGTWAVVCVSQDWWVLGSVGVKIHGPWGQWVWGSMALGSVDAGVHVPEGCGCMDSLLWGCWMLESVDAGVCMPQS